MSSVGGARTCGVLQSCLLSGRPLGGALLVLPGMPGCSRNGATTMSLLNRKAPDGAPREWPHSCFPPHA
jgi:hypothetical protein